MKALYDDHPLTEFYNVLKNAIANLKDAMQSAEFRSPNAVEDPICKLILQNNGCAFGDKTYFEDIKLVSTPNYAIKFVYGGKANTILECYDYIEFYGMRYLVIFMDEFIDLHTDEPDPIFGRGQYVDKFSKLVDVFIQTAYPVGANLHATCAGNMYRFAPTLIACSIIDELFGLQESDINTMPYGEVREMLDNVGIGLLTVGIRIKE